MDQLTIRGVTPELEKAVRAIAKRRGTSMSQAALYLMRRGAQLPVSEDASSPIGNSLDANFGSLHKEDADAVQNAVEELDRVCGASKSRNTHPAK